MVYILSLITVCAVSFALAFYAWTRSHSPATRAYAVVALTQGLWTLYFVLDPITPSLPVKLILDHLAWMVAYLLEIAVLRFTLAYSGKRWSRRVWVLVTFPMLLFILASFTNESLHLMYSATRIVVAPPYSFLDVDYTPISWAAYIYGYALIPVALWQLARHYADISAPFRTHTAIIIAGVAIPGLFSLSSLLFALTSGSPIGSLALASAYALGTLLIAIGIFRFRAFRVAPIARQFIFDRMSDAVIVVDSDQRIADVNPAVQPFIAQGLESLIGKTIEEAFPTLIEAFKGFSKESDVDTRFSCTLSGQSYSFDLKIRTIEDQRGRQRGRLGVIRDITEQVRLEEFKLSEETLKVALEKERELSELKSKMMTQIAHEFRTPLSVIALSSETLGKYFDRLSTDRRQEKLDEIKRRVRQLTEMLDDISTVVQNDYGTLNDPLMAFNLGDLCRECADAQRVQQGNRCLIDVSVQSPERTVVADKHGLHVIVTEMLANAAKYSPEGGKIQLRTWFEGTDLSIQVSDQGIGIADEDIKRLFEPFFRGNNTDDFGGLGLGLSIVQDYVRRHDGNITVESQPGRGSIFTIRLPKVAVREIPEHVT